MIATWVAKVAVSGDPPKSEAVAGVSESSFERIYSENGRDLLTYLSRMCGDRTLAEDLFQRTFVRFLEAENPPREGRQVRSYLFRIATNLAIDHWRTARREEELPADLALPIDPGTALRADMARIFAKLDARTRALLWLAHVEELDHEEIAQSIGVSKGSVRVLLFRARRKLGSLLSRVGMGPEVLR